MIGGRCIGRREEQYNEGGAVKRGRSRTMREVSSTRREKQRAEGTAGGSRSSWRQEKREEEGEAGR